MGRHLVPATMVAAMVAFATAALTAGASPGRPSWWPAAVALVVLGGITPMIYAVNIWVVPVFARRPWPGLGWLRLKIALALAGAWIVFGGRLADARWAVVLGNALALAGGVVFTANVVRLFRQSPAGVAPPLPFPEQAAVDKLATRFTQLSGVYLLIGLSIGLMTAVWRPGTGRWDLVWAHAMLVGFFLSMAAGVCYHVLSRWTGRPWRSITPIRLHLVIVQAGLPLMLLALATNWHGLFLVAGPLQAAALLLFLVTIAPMVPALPGQTRPALAAATICLLAGVGLGAAFAIDPALGARLRLVHAEVNLFGWTGLLISGVGYYLVPRFAGRPLCWPRLATVQLGCLGGGAVLGTVVHLWRAYGEHPPVPLGVAQILIALGFLLFGALIAATFRGRPGTMVTLSGERAKQPGTSAPRPVTTTPAEPGLRTR